MKNTYNEILYGTSRSFYNKFLKKMENEINNPDKEAAQGNADNILCDLLMELGYEEIVTLYKKIDKW